MNPTVVHPALAEMLGNPDDERAKASMQLIGKLDAAQTMITETMSLMPPGVFCDFLAATHAHATLLQAMKGPQGAMGSMLLLSLTMATQAVIERAEEQVEGGNCDNWWFIVVDDDHDIVVVDHVDEESCILTGAPDRQTAEEMLPGIREKFDIQ